MEFCEELIKLNIDNDLIPKPIWTTTQPKNGWMNLVQNQLCKEARALRALFVLPLDDGSLCTSVHFNA